MRRGWSRHAMPALLVAFVAAAPGAVASRADAEACRTSLYGTTSAGPNQPSDLYLVDALTGAPSAIGPIGFNRVGAIDFHPISGALYGVGRRTSDGVDVLITIDVATGLGTEVGPLLGTAAGAGHFDLSFRSSDAALFLLAFDPLDQDQVALFRVDPATGEATEIGSGTGTLAPGNALGFDRLDALFHVDGDLDGPSPPALYSVDPLAGTSSFLRTLSFIGFPALDRGAINALDFNPATDAAYVAVNDGGAGSGPNYLGTLSPATGQVANVGVTVTGLDGLAWRADCDDRDPCTDDFCKRCEPPPGHVPPLDVITVDCTPFVSPGPSPFGPTHTIGTALQDVDHGGDFNVTEVTPAAFRALAAGQLAQFDLIAINNDPGRIECGSGQGMGASWQGAVGVASGGRIALVSHDAPRYHIEVPPGGPPLHGGFEPFGARDLLRQTALWAGGGTRTGLVIFNDAPGLVGGLGWDNPALNLPALWGIADLSQLPGLGDGGYTEILAGFAGHPLYDATADGGALLTDERFGPSSIGSFADESGDTSFHSVFASYNAAIFTPSEVVTHAGETDVGGLCPGCTLLAAPGPNGAAITLIREEQSPCPLGNCVLFGAAHVGGMNGASTLYTIDPATGAATAVGPIGFNAVSGLDFDAESTLYGTGFRPADGEHVLLTIDPATGQGSEVGPTGIVGLGAMSMTDVSFRNVGGTLYGFLELNDELATLDTVSGTASVVGATLGAGCCGEGIAFTSRDLLFHANDVALDVLDPFSGLALPVATADYSTFPAAVFLYRVNAMDADPCRRVMYASVADGNGGSGPNWLATVNLATGVVSPIGLTVTGLDAIAWRRESAAGICCHDPVPDLDGDGLCNTIDPCPHSPNPGGGATSVFQTVVGRKTFVFPPAPPPTPIAAIDFSWPTPADFVVARGSFTLAGDIRSYPLGFTTTGSGEVFADPLLLPPAGSGLWYLFRPECAGGSWSSAGPGECAGTPDPCVPGGRDGSLP